MLQITNMITKIKNAQNAHHERVLVPHSKMKFAVAQLLSKSGFIGEIEKKNKKMKKSEQSFIEIKLLPEVNGESHINGVKFVSKPSRRTYAGYWSIHPVKSGYGIAVISTSKGLMTDTEARKAKIGGELLFEIW